jgi:hypothetical protein
VAVGKAAARSGIGVEHRTVRLILRLLVFAVATFATGVALWFALLLLGFAFGESTPECTDSDTCGAWGDFLYHTWPGTFTCFALGAIIWWLLLRPVRR